jgi:hypothetical protein
MIGSGVKVEKQYGMTKVNLNNLGYLDEPFVRANDVAQVFYVKDINSKPRKRKDKKNEYIMQRADTSNLHHYFVS